MRRATLLVALLTSALAPLAAQEAPLPDGWRALAETPDEQSDITLQIAGEETVELWFAWQAPQQGYRLKLTPTASLLERLDGATVELDRAGAGWVGAGNHTVLLRRRDMQLYIIVDGQHLLAALDGAWRGGRVVVPEALAERVAVVEDSYQPAEDIYFTDDFMRTEDQQQLGVWRHVSGKWRFYSVKETNEKADVKLSVNPFSLGLDSAGEAPSAVVTGFPFWTDYEYSASVRCRGGGWAGILFSQRADDDYFLLRADLAELPIRPRRIELVRVKGGQETLLAGGTTLLTADQWYRFGVRLRGPRVQCLLDDDVIFDRIEREATGGPIGLWSSGDGSESLFDDIRCMTNLTWPFDRAATLQPRRLEAKGQWTLQPAAGDPIGNDPGPRKLASPNAETGRYVLGDPAASEYRIDAVVTPKTHGKVAWLFAWRDEANYHFTEWDTRTGKLSIGQVADGKVKPLGLVTDKLTAEQPHQLALDLLTPGYVQVRRDGMLRMRAAVAELPAGRFGIAKAETPLTVDQLELRQYVPVDTEVEVDNANFADDPFMLHWASSMADWFPKGEPKDEANKQQIYWHKGDFYQAYEIEFPVATSAALLLNAREENWVPPNNDKLGGGVVRIGAGPAPAVDAAAAEAEQAKADAPPVAGSDAGDGYSLYIVPDKPQARVYFFRQGALVKEAKLPEGADMVTVAHDGGVTWLAANGQDVLTYHDHQPLDGPRVALRVNGNDELYRVKCRREGIIDEVFERAPADWLQQGLWEITNRFSCTPTWSHMTALERGGLGALWHKDAFAGNVTVEYYAGMRMQSDYAMTYPRPGDFNTTVHAQPLSLESGISFIPGAWDPGWTSVWTRFVKGTETLLETDQPLVPRTREDGGRRYIPVPYISAGRDIHGAWYYVKTRLVDGKLEGYFDNVKVLEGKAPEAPGDRFAVWTQDNQVVLARVRITYEHKRVPNRLLNEAPVERTPRYPEPVMVTVAEAPGLAFDFEDSPDGWTTRQTEPTETIEVVNEGDRRFLMVKNMFPGDRLEAVMPVGNKDAGQLAELSLARAAVLRFDYRIAPSAKINAYLTLNDRRYFIPLSGDRTDTAALPMLLNPGAIKADGEWHTARLPLAAALRETFGQAAVKLTDFRFGQLHQGYLLAGFGGNGRGAWYAIDNFAIVPETAASQPLTVSLQMLSTPSGTTPSLKSIRTSLDRSASATPTAHEGGLTAPAESGVWYLHAQGELPDGTLTEAAHLPILVNAAAPKLAPLATDQPWDGERVSFAVDDVPPLDLTLTVGEQTVGWDRVELDPVRQELAIDLGSTGLSFAEAQPVVMKVAAKFPSGQTSEQVFQRVYSRNADTTPPRPPVVSGATLSFDFERPELPWKPSQPNQTALERVADSAVPGGHSVRVVNLAPSGNMALSLISEATDVGRKPLLMFDYKVPEPLRSDFVFYFPREYYALNFTDHSSVYSPLGAVAETQRDGQWHRGTFNLQKALAQASPFAPDIYSLRQMLMADYGYSGAAPAASYQLDNLRLVQVVSGAKGFTLSWQTTDPGGVAGYRYGWSEDETTSPTTAAAGEVVSQEFRLEGDGLRWFAIQAVDTAGNWSAVTRVPVLLDSTPPLFGTPTPAPGALGTSDVTIPITGVELADLDPASLKWTAGGKTVPVKEGFYTYLPGRHQMVWDWAWATEQFSGKVADGTALKLGVTGSDLAGNEAAAGSWDYTVSYAADQQPPLAPAVTVVGQPVERLETCTAGLGQLGYQAGGYRSPRQRVLAPDRNDFVCEVTTTGSGIPLAYGKMDLKAHPYLSFDYKLGKRIALHLLVYVNNTYYSIALNGRSRSYKQIGTTAITADEKWHTAVIDLGALLAKELPKADSLDARYIQIDEYGSSGGQNYWVDNVAVFGAVAKEKIATSWVNYDATGIQAAATAFGAGVDGALPTEVKADQTALELTAAKPGVYLLQVRSQDGAGNLGGAARRVIVAR